MVVLTGIVLTVKVVEVAPAGTMPVAGRVATADALLDKEIITPPAGAGLFKVTLPMTAAPPRTLVELMVSCVTRIGVTVNVALLVLPPALTVTVTSVGCVTGPVVMGNVVLATPTGTVTDGGTVAADVMSLASAITIPPQGAGPLSVTVPVALLPLVTLAGVMVMPVSVVGESCDDDGVTVTVALLVMLPPVAVMVTDVDWATVVVVIVNVALVAPAATVTAVGTVATESLALSSATTTPLAGAGPFNVTVPTLLLPPRTVAGLIVSLDNAGGVTVSVSDVVTSPMLAVTVATVVCFTGLVVIVKVALVAPLAIITVAGALAAAVLLAIVTVAPLAGAATSIVTVPVADVPPPTVTGEMLRPVSVGGLTVRFICLLIPSAAPVIATDVGWLTGLVMTVKVAPVAPAGTMTDVGTAATAVFALVSDTATPSSGAGVLNVIVPVAITPPATVVGLMVIPNVGAGVTVRLTFLVTPPSIAIIVTTADWLTLPVVMANVALAAPAGMVIAVGTVAVGSLLLSRSTVTPPGGANPSSVTVPVAVPPLWTVPGLTDSPFNEAGITVSPALMDMVPVVAVTEPEVTAVTLAVVMVNVALVTPAGTTTEAGTATTDGVSLARVTDRPPAGAAPLSITLLVTDLPPTTLGGWIFNPVSVGGSTNNVPDPIPPPYLAEMSTTVLALTGVVVASKLAVDWPAGTRTKAGICKTFGLLLESPTCAPPDGAGPPKVTVPVVGVPPTRLRGAKMTHLTGARIHSELELDMPLSLAYTLTIVFWLTGDVSITKVALVDPSGTVTEPVVEATLALLVEVDTRLPPAGAGPLNVILAVAEVPPRTASGSILTVATLTTVVCALAVIGVICPCAIITSSRSRSRGNMRADTKRRRPMACGNAAGMRNPFSMETGEGKSYPVQMGMQIVPAQATGHRYRLCHES